MNRHGNGGFDEIQDQLEHSAGQVVAGDEERLPDAGVKA